MNQNGLVGREADNRDDGVLGEDEVECLPRHGSLPFVLSCTPLPRSPTFQLFWAGQLLSPMQFVFLMLALASSSLDFGEMPEALAEDGTDPLLLLLSLVLRRVASSALPLFSPVAAPVRAPVSHFAASHAHIRGVGYGWP